MNDLMDTTLWLHRRWLAQAPMRAKRATDRLWFHYNPPRTEWWVKLAQWCIRRSQQIVGHYRYWRYVRRL